MGHSANVKPMTMDLCRKRSGSAVLNVGNRIIFLLFERKGMFKNEEEGKLGYIGDVNAEDGSNAVVLAMCGLL